MEFIKTAGWERGIEDITTRLTKELKAGKKVLWLTSGGSNIAATVSIMAAIPEEQSKHLSIFLADERYGEVGHANSNAKHLHDAGFQPKDAIFVAALQPGFDMQETQERFAQALERAADHADIIISQLGIGPDGHIAGILPHSPAVTATGWTFAYETPTYHRVTMTFDALRHIDVDYSFVFGDDKREALARLHDEELALDEQPSQILKELNEAYVYNDQIGDK